jgi:hypothetical protein
VTYPHSPTPGPRPGPPPGGVRPGPPPGGYGPAPARQPADDARPVTPAVPDDGGRLPGAGAPDLGTQGTGHPAVDAVLRSLANAAQLAPADQIAEYEAAHQVLRETLASIDR